MKSRFAMLIFAGSLAWVLLTSTMSGYRYNQTGSTGYTGCSCHGPSSSINPTLELDSAGIPVVSYVPGMSYTVKLSGTEVSADPYFGFEVSVVKASGAGTGSAVQAGTWGTLPSGAKANAAQVMIEQNTRISASNNMYTMSIPWTAPAAGTGSVMLYGIINGVNGDGNTSGDGAQNATNDGLTITESTSCPTVSITASGNVLTANAAGATTYQWYDNGTAISGATSSTYTATATGSYTVAITAGSCNETSPAYPYTSTGIGNISLQQDVKVYPTLTTDMINIEALTNTDNLKYEIIGMNGSLYMNGSLTPNTINTLDLHQLAAAVYIIRLSTENASAVYKIVKQ